MPTANVSIPNWFIKFLSVCMGIVIVLITGAVPFFYSLKADVTGVKVEVKLIQKTLDRHERIFEKINNNGRK